MDCLFVLNRLVDEITGLNQAVMQRANLLSNNGFFCNVVTMRFDPYYYRSLGERLKCKTRLDRNVGVLNLYEYFKDESFLNEVRNDIFLDLEVERTGNVVRAFKNGVYIKYVKFKSNGLIDVVDYYDHSRYNYMSEEYDDYNNPVRQTYKDLVDGLPRNQYYLRSDGTVYLSKWYKKKSGKSTVIRITIFNRDGSIKFFCSNEKQLKHFFLDCLTGAKKACIVADARSVDSVVSDYKNDNVKKIAMIHNLHINKPYKDYLSIEGSHLNLFGGRAGFDVFVCATDWQKNDLVSSGLNVSKVYSVPHALRASITENKKPSSAPFSIMVSARLSKQKQVDHAIKAFSLIASQYECLLHIYGNGPEKNNLVQLSRDLEIDERVIFHGYVDDIMSIYSEHDFLIMTSSHEGFGLVVLESISKGTPVASYDVKYGPRNVILEGETGFLCEPDDVNMLAAKIQEIFADPIALSHMKKNCLKSLVRFEEKSFVKGWSDIFLDS